MTATTNGAYDDSSVACDTEGSLESARVVVPVVLKFVQPNSVIDFGCGRGAWLKAFQENGAQTIRGLDGEYVDQSKLLIEKSAFQAVDLSSPRAIEGRWDLAVCVEVAEHLPDKASRPLVRALTTAAPVVLFAAAIPAQTGTCHINEQWPDYWRSRFAERGYRRLDPIRRHIWQDSRVGWWYQQNLFLFVCEDGIAKSAALQEEEKRSRDLHLELIHEDVLNRFKTLRGIFREVPRAAWRAVRRRLSSPG